MLRQIIAGLCLILVAGSPNSVFAQGLIWNAPAEGTEVQYEGDYVQEDERPEEVEKRITLEWRRRLWIRALAKTNAEYKGETVPCQWFEIEVVTASEAGGDGRLVPGPGGRRLYKVLVPLERANIGPGADGKIVDKQGIPVAYLPVVKGYRRIDEQAVEPITSGVLNTYPMLTLMAHYRDLEKVAENTDPEVSLQSVNSATHYHGELVIESPTNRSTNKAEIYANPSVPFGLARWNVEIARETKDGKAPRDQYELASTFRVDMKIVDQSTGAVSKLAEE